MCKLKGFDNLTVDDLVEIRDRMRKVEAVNGAIYKELDAKSNGGESMDYKEIADMQRLIEVQADYITAACDLINAYI